jgi:hypothetical protein
LRNKEHRCFSVTSLRRVSVTPYKVRQRRGAVHSKEALQCLCADLSRHEGEPSLRAWTHSSVSPKHPLPSTIITSGRKTVAMACSLGSHWRQRGPAIIMAQCQESSCTTLSRQVIHPLSSPSPEYGDAESVRGATTLALDPPVLESFLISSKESFIDTKV